MKMSQLFSSVRVVGAISLAGVAWTYLLYTLRDPYFPVSCTITVTALILTLLNTKTRRKEPSETDKTPAEVPRVSAPQPEHSQGDWFEQYKRNRLKIRGVRTLEQTLEQPTVEHLKKPTVEQDFGTQEALEHRKPQELVLTDKAAVLTPPRPSKEDLDALKKAMGITKGTLQYKQRGQGIYLVTYDPQSKRRTWKLLGSWRELANRLTD